LAIENAKREETILAIILSLILNRQRIGIENSASRCHIQSTLSACPLTFGGIEFDFHIIIVYTIYRKSQGPEALHPIAIIG
jgi:hypothetical protein